MKSFFFALQPECLWNLEEDMKLEAKEEGWRGGADGPSVMRHEVYDLRGSDMSISSISWAGVLLQMWLRVSIQHLYSALKYKM